MAKSLASAQKVAVFLGAGASKPFGGMLTGEILPEMLTALRAGQLFGKGSPLHKELKDLLDGICPDLGSTRAPPLDITELLTLVDYFTSARRSVWHGLSLERLARLRVLIGLGICNLLYDPKPVDPRTCSLVQPWMAWLEAVVRASWSAVDIAIITTNYDRIVDKMLWDCLGHDEIDGVDFGLDWFRADAGIDERIVRIPARPRVRNYKLHGSLDMVACRECERVYISSEDNYLVPLMRRSRISECHCGNHPLEHVMVAPSHARVGPFPRIREVWRRAGDFLRKAEGWIIVGYSMPPEDLLVKDLLLTSLRRSEVSGGPRIDVVQGKRTASGDRFDFYLGASASLRTYYGGLEAYVGKRGSLFSSLRDSM